MSLQSELLDNISTITGGDGYSFIPDVFLLGNVFIHGKFPFNCCYESKISIDLSDGVLFQDNINYKELYIPSLKYGKKKTYIIYIKQYTQIKIYTIKCSLYIDDKTITSSYVES